MMTPTAKYRQIESPDSVNNVLRRMGYGHRRASEHGCKHEVYRLSDGVVIGKFHAADAIDAALADKEITP